MPEERSPRQVIPLHPDFFCDGHYYVLTSVSLGGSDMPLGAIADILGYGQEAGIRDLLERGICLPLCFEGDCALDGKTLFVLGDLTAQEENDWIARLVWKLKVPCGKLLILCGGGDEGDWIDATSGNPPKPTYRIFQVMEVPPGEYQVEVYAYLASMTVQVSLSEYDQHWNLIEHEALRQWYEDHRPGDPEVGYIIRLTPLEAAPPFPELLPEISWCGNFEFRQPEL
ncbi:hypothetical protein [Geitlerinema sp. PCC 7407]|uniref:hypothetical protein n=1 Tax=Geitlerinema sp. PCC 7407 TaxID=1173025 RepID=UPI00029FAD1E|nr:hypothetical protein [Geitlerinema sp. PCC 7407]AFY68111.1 hypothetical protein GEI7407_3644 [Geitlerinema sp. PCC 7407]